MTKAWRIGAGRLCRPEPQREHRVCFREGGSWGKPAVSPMGIPDALLAGREDPVRVERVLQAAVEAGERAVAPRVLLGDEVHEREMRAVDAVAGLGRRAD